MATYHQNIPVLKGLKNYQYFIDNIISIQLRLNDYEFGSDSYI